MQVRVNNNPKEFGKCGCGRSPTGKCCGWHGLTEEQYQHEKDMYNYRAQAQEIWFKDGSCTGGSSE